MALNANLGGFFFLSKRFTGDYQRKSSDLDWRKYTVGKAIFKPNDLPMERVYSNNWRNVKGTVKFLNSKWDITGIVVS